MAENSYSSNIKKAIIQFAQSCNGKYSSIRKEPKISLKTPYKSTAFYHFPYIPEVCLTQKRRDGVERHIIFEILDSQLKTPNLIIADVIQALLVEGSWRVVFIAPTTEGYDKARELSETIGGLLIARLADATSSFVSETTLKKIVKQYALAEIPVYKISSQEAKNPKKLHELLTTWSEEDSW